MKPAKSWICYFSPTGTSRRVAEAVGRGLNCTQTVVCDATHDAVCVAAERGDAAVFAVPVYGGHAAPLALRRLDAVRGDGTPAVVVVLYGNRAYEHAACELADFVAARGFVPVAAAAFVGEHSYSTARWPIAAGRPDGGRLRRGRGLRARRGGETRCRRGAGDRCEEVADRAQRDALDVAVRAVRTRLPPQSEAASATGGGRDLGRQVHALRPLCETLPDGSHRRRRRASYRCGEVYPLLCLRQGMSRRRTQLRFSLRTRAVA